MDDELSAFEEELGDALGAVIIDWDDEGDAVARSWVCVGRERDFARALREVADDLDGAMVN